MIKKGFKALNGIVRGVKRKIKNRDKTGNRKVLVVFIVCVITCSFLSRAASAILTPYIETVSPSTQPIEHIVVMDGWVMAGREQQIYVQGGFLVDEIYVSEKDHIEPGTALLKYNVNTLEEEYAEKGQQLHLCELQRADNWRNRSDFDQAKIDVEAYETLITEQEDYIYGLENEIEQERQEREEAIAYEVEKLTILNLSFQNQLTRQMEQAEINYYNDLIMSNNMRLQQLQTESMLLQNFEASGNKDELLRIAESDLELLQTELSNVKADLAVAESGILGEIDVYRLNTEIEDLKNRMDEIDLLVAADGIVYSDMEGEIVAVNITAGGYSTDTAAFAVADSVSGFYISADATEEDVKYISAGARVEVMLSDSQEMCSVSSIDYDIKDNVYRIRIEPEGDVYLPGMKVVLKFTSKSSEQGYSIPIEAVRSDRNGAFILIVVYRKGILGEEMVAGRVPVKIQDSNASYAVVSGGLSGKEQVITSSTKPVEAGDTVRYRE
ncbi:MAG: hypothetical protein K2K20_03715 [Lachnospiraceae bacterium]|nr:hypothetical protein [Lachnospiraceae bacterium]